MRGSGFGLRRHIEDHLDSSSEAPVATGLRALTGVRLSGGPARPAWNASSDSHCVTTQ
ncbi:hypothetical protein GTA26_24700 [Rhodococcus hoagii]|nr:hypothetical protein [Prescottella equi]